MISLQLAVCFELTFLKLTFCIVVITHCSFVHCVTFIRFRDNLCNV